VEAPLPINDVAVPGELDCIVQEVPEGAAELLLIPEHQDLAWPIPLAYELARVTPRQRLEVLH
jgi:hypothetical protein